MNKKIILLSFFILINHFSFGQTDFGFRVGNGISVIKSGNSRGGFNGLGFSSPIWSYSLFSNFQTRLHKNLHLEGGIGFARKGFAYNIKYYFKEERIRAIRTMKVISIQAIPTYFILEKKKKQKLDGLGIQIGGYGSYLFNHKWKYADEKAKQVNGSMKQFDMGIVFGAILSRRNKRKNYTIDFRYSQSVFDVSASADDTKIRVFEMGVGIMFNLKK